MEKLEEGWLLLLQNILVTAREDYVKSAIAVRRAQRHIAKGDDVKIYEGIVATEKRKMQNIIDWIYSKKFGILYPSLAPDYIVKFFKEESEKIINQNKTKEVKKKSTRIDRK